jgi:hypothetical protein
MPKDQNRYNAAARRAYPRTACPECGAPLVRRWLDVTAKDDTERWWVPGLADCPDYRKHPGMSVDLDSL